MKNIFLLFSMFLISTALAGQDNFYFSQYFQVGPAFNPALTGIENFTDIKFNYRSQWSGFTDAPQTNFFGIYGYLQKETQHAYKQYSLRTSHPNYLDELPRGQIPLGSKIRHGIGGHTIYDVQGPFVQMSGFINYALHMRFSSKFNISLGVSGSITDQRIDLEKIILSNPDDDEFYQALIAAGGRNTYFDINPGIVFYNSRFYLSYAAFRIIRKPISTDDVQVEDPEIDHNMMVGFKIPLSQKVKLLPSFLLNLNQQYGSIWDANMKMLIDEKLWTGISYKSTQSLSFMAGMYLNNLLNLAYSYDYLTSEFNNYSNGSHEITLGLMLYKKDLKAPYLW